MLFSNEYEEKKKTEGKKSLREEFEERRKAEKEKNKAEGNKSLREEFEYRRKYEKAPEIGELLYTRATALGDYNDSFINDYKSRYFDGDGNYISSYRGDTEDWRSSVQNRKKAYDEESAYLKGLAEEYKDFLNEDFVNSLFDSLDKNGKIYSDVLDYADKDIEYYSKWANEDEYNKAIADAEEYERLLGIDTDALDEELKYYKDFKLRLKESGMSAEKAYAYGDLIDKRTKEAEGKEKYLYIDQNTLQQYLKLGKVVEGQDGKYYEYGTGKEVKFGADPSEAPKTVKKYVKPEDYPKGAIGYSKKQFDTAKLSGLIQKWTDGYYHTDDGTVVYNKDDSYIEVPNEYYSDDNVFKFENKYDVSIADLYRMSPEELDELIATKTNDYQKAVKYQEDKRQQDEFEAYYSELSANDDWAENSQYISTVDDSNWWAKEFNTDWEYESVNRMTGRGAATAWGYAEDNRGYADVTTEQEKAIFNYLYHTEGKEAAFEWHNSRKNMYQDRREGNAIADLIKRTNEHPWAASAFSIVTSLGSGVEFIADAGKYLFTGELDDNHLANATNAIRGTVSEKVDWEIGNWDAFDFLYNTGMSMADSLVSTAMFGNFGGLALGLSAASQGVNNALERGLDNRHAFWSGLMSGVFEGLFESVSIGNFSALKESFAAGGKDFIKNLAKSMLVNATEETLTEVANIAYDFVMNGDLSNYEVSIRKYMDEGLNYSEAKSKASQDLGVQVAEALASGALMGLGMGGIGQGISAAESSWVGSKINKGGLTQQVLDVAKTFDVGTTTSDIASKLGDNPSAYQIGALLRAEGADINNQNRADIVKALESKGFDTDTANRIAGLMLDSKNTMFANSRGVTEEGKVYNDLINNSDSTVNQRTQQYLDVIDGISKKKSGKNVAAKTDVTTNDAVEKTSSDSFVPYSNEYIERTAKMYEEMGMSPEDAKIMAVAQLSNSNPNTSTPTAENIVESKYEVSDDGKTTNLKTGNAVEIKKIESISDSGEANLTVDGGDVVKASDISFSSPVEALFVETIGAIKVGNKPINIDSANALYQMAMTAWKNNPNMTANEAMYLIKGLEESYVHGAYNFGRSSLTARNEDGSAKRFAGELSQEQRNFAYNLGVGYSIAKTKADQKAIDDIKARADKKASSDTTAKKGRVRFEDGVAPKGKLQKRTVALAKHLARAIGIDIVFYDARTTSNPEGKGANGYFDEDTDTIYLDLQNSWDDAKTIVYTMSHELVHFIKKWSPEKFDTFAKFLMKQYGKHGVDTSELLSKKMTDLGTEDTDLAYEEMICDACETMLLDSDAVYKLMELRKTDLELFDKIKLHIHELLNKIRGMYKELGLEPTSDEAKALLEMKDVLEQIYALFEEAAVDATQSYQAVQNANETLFGEESVDIGKTESGIKNQLKNHKKIGEDATAYNNRHKNVLNSILQVGIESMYEMAETMLPYLEVDGILPPDIPGKTIFKNGSYGRTGENTTLCVRTLTYEDFKDRVAENLGRPLTVSESLLVSQKIYDIATDPQCIYCYVAADRKAYDGYLGGYWKAMDKYIKAMRKGGDSKALYTEYLAGRKDTDAQKKRWSQWEAIAKSGKEYISAKDLTTKRKRDVLIAKKNAFSEQIKDAQRYAQSASWAKTVFEYRAYKGDILKMTSTFVNMLNSEYGLRMYSFSDYTPAFIVENMQMLIDASVKGLKSLAYTKDTDYAEIFASTGQAINVSCFARWDAELGTYVEDNRQGANWEKTKSLRQQYRNVGAVMVATNDAMVEWALKQDWVDVVIPYHIVKTGTTIANEYQWNNYTSESADRIGNKTANIYPTEHNNDFATYSNLLNERGITPRFSKWYDMVASGKLTENQYMKLVNEVRLPASELSAVVPSFNLEAAKKSFGIDNDGNVIKGGFVDKGGYMGGWYREGVDVNQEVMAVSEDIKAGKSSLDVDYGMSKVAKEKVEEKYTHSIKKQAKPSKRDPRYLDPRTITEKDVYEMLENVTFGAYYDDSYIPLRRNTPEFFINVVKEHSKGNYFIEDCPIAATVRHLSQNMEEEDGQSYGEERPHEFSPDEIITMSRKMGDPSYIVFQENKRYAEVVSFYNKRNKKVVVVIDMANSQVKPPKNFKYAQYMNGYDQGYYNIVITQYEPDDFQDYLNKNEVVYDKKEMNGKYQVGSGRIVTVTHDTPFIEDIVPQENVESQEKHIKKQLKKSPSSYAPTFYSQMGKVIEGVKQEKLAANSVVNLLRGKGVKGEEIRWSGIVPFLEGKKSITKQELLDFINGSMLQIGEELSASENEAYKELNRLWEEEVGGTIDEYLNGEPLNEDNLADIFDDMYKKGLPVPFIETQLRMIELARNAESNVRWSQYKLDGGSNYREIVFTLPNSSYSNKMMRVHWGEDAEGILVHARIQDFDVNGKKMLFIEEIQSDYHNEGHKDGYQDDSQLKELQELEAKANEAFLAVEDYSTELTGLAGEYEAVAKTQKGRELLRAKIRAEKELKQAQAKFDSKVPDAPFKDNYHEYVLKRLLRMAAEQGYDSIGWTPSEIQADRWSDEFAEGYRIEYDQEMPKFLRKYGRQWGAKVDKTRIATKQLSMEEELDNALIDDMLTDDERNNFKGGYEVWSMDITDPMKNSVLTEGQPLYQKKTTTNRTILAESLESAAQNDIERNKLKLYKEKISLIEKEEQRLAEIQKQLFTKGAVEPEQRKALQFEAKQISNRINTYDRQLLNLESTTALKNVLNREKALARKKQKQIDAEAMKKYREKVAETTRELMDRHKESRKKAIESRNRTAMRHKIKTVVNDLNQLLLKGSKERNVKLGLQSAVASALEAVNMDTVAADERIAKLEQELMKAKTPEKIQELSRKIDNIREQGDRMASKLEALRKAYAKIKANKEGVPEYYKAEASMIEDRIESVMEIVGNTPLRNMSLDQLEAVHDLYSMVLATVRNANSVFMQGKLEDLQKNASDTMEEISAIRTLPEERVDMGWLRSYSWNEMIPIYAFRRIGSQTLEKFFWEAIRGQNTVATDLAEANDFAKATRDKYGYGKWDLDKVHEFKLADGRTFRVTLRHMMSIYAYSKRHQALDHMTKGGFFFNDKSTFRKKGGIISLIKSNEVGYCIGYDTLESIVKEMTDEQIKYVDEMQTYLTKMGDKGNEVSRVLWGIDIFKEKVYFPLKSVKDFIFQANQTAQESSLKNDGMTKETKPGASNPIVLEAFDDVWASHVNRMSQYHGLVLPIENLNKVHNYGTWAGTDSMSVSTMLRARFGEAVNDYLNQFIKDLNGASSTSGATNPFFGFVGKFKKTAVAASTSVVVQQPTAILRAMAVLDTKYFIGLPENHLLSTKWNEVQKYAPIAIIKEIGGFDAGAGRQATQWLNSDTLRGIDKVAGKVDDITMMGAAIGDQIGWCAIWEAVKREVKATTNLEVGSEEFLKAVGDRFTEVIVLTQVYDSTLSRSGFMRSKHDSVKMLTSFMGEPTVSINMMFDATVQAKRGTITKRKAGRIVGAVYASVVAAFVMASLVYALRDDDEDESYVEKFLEALGGKILTDIIPLNMLPGIRDIISIFDGWDVERTDMAVFKDIKDAFDGLSSEKKSPQRKIEDFAGAIASLFGVPLKNTLRSTREVYNGIKNIFDDITPSGVGDAFVRGITGEKKDKVKALYDAIVNDDDARLEIYRKGYKDEDAYQNAVRKALRDNDPRIREAAEALLDKDVTEYDRITNEIIEEGKFDIDDIKAAVKSEYNDLKPDEEKSETADEMESIYYTHQYYDALIDGDTAMADKVKEDIISTEIANGKSEADAKESFYSSFKNNIRDGYANGTLSREKAMDMLVEYAGLDDNEAYWQMDKYDYYATNGTTDGYSKYGEFYEAVKTGKNLKSVIKRYTDHGVKDSTLATQITSYYKPLYIAMTNKERAGIKGYLLNAYALLGKNRAEKSRDIDNWLKKK